jgi:proline dehydrogenase
VRKLKRLVRPLWRAVAARAARAYVAGDTLGDAVRVARRWQSRRVATTIGYWNDSEDAAELVQQACLDCVAATERALPGGYVSIKLPGLGYREDLLAPIARGAARAGFRLHFDALEIGTVDRTWAVLDALRTSAPDVGCTLPGRWKRSLEDADWAAARGLAVRVVKGQWEDPDDPERDPADGFLEVVARLAGRARHVAVATHHSALAARCFDVLARRGTSAELELLHGLPMRRALAMARRRGIPARVYVPYGTSFLPYSLDYVERNPRVVFWIVRDFVGG